MRSQFWIFCLGLVCVVAYPRVTLAAKTSSLNSVEPTIFNSTENMPTTSRFLRRDSSVTTKTATNVDHTTDTEERSVNIGTGVADKIAGISIKTIEGIFKGVAKVVGQATVGKFRGLVRRFTFKVLYKTGSKPADMYARAEKQTHPALKERYELAAKLYEAYYTSMKKVHHV
ncbi:RxLR effector protein [Phytophthora megakarya]|uniref:RxLR effector protein n=1 Tax=Phytophthora megakarya TaxID=4795 RepID=A0A225V1Z8_9STRA|nr:RxLR effector protein [Phytophthora megakarya]